MRETNERKYTRRERWKTVTEQEEGKTVTEVADGQDVAHASMNESTDVINTMHHIPVLDGNIAKFFIALKINHDKMLKIHNFSLHVLFRLNFLTAL